MSKETKKNSGTDGKAEGNAVATKDGESKAAEDTERGRVACELRLFFILVITRIKKKATSLQIIQSSLRLCESFS